jgi:hypothetical protein
MAELDVLHEANRIYLSKTASASVDDRAQHQLRQGRLKMIRAELNKIAAAPSSRRTPQIARDFLHALSSLAY